MAGSVNLAYEVGPDRRPTAGTRLEIPPELKGTFRLFTRFGTRLRARHGEGTKRHIKFDDFKGSLVTNVKLPGDENWTRVTPQMAKDDLEALMREEDSRNQARLAAKLVPGPRERLALPQPGARPGVRGRQAPMNSAAPSGKRPRWSGPAAKTSLGYPIDGAYSEDEEEDNDNDDSAPLSDSADQINHEKDHNCARLLLTNARSLLPKEDSLVDVHSELEAQQKHIESVLTDQEERNLSSIRKVSLAEHTKNDKTLQDRKADLTFFDFPENSKEPTEQEKNEMLDKI